ncbi:Ubiquitin-conjugating enzyme 34 isoform 1 [Hibiscus syriacus]|uniref:Ubiquitin-conjugating enzyme 34 isoform 1 n=1 Tax=Hibiscus syriacus TaxID=106335 RepID=A0A6A2YG41_HIBSY|nr:Ubiquitin-conjugating enzyme 34 isoform 1 [Hibiscus syriacus]
MKANTRAPSVLTLFLLLWTSLYNLERAEARQIRHGHSSLVLRTVKGSASRVFGDLQADKRNHQKLVDSSFRRIPPSTSNPIGNK